MILRIDLLRNRERRYQGPVSGRFLRHTAVVTAVVAVLLFVAQRAYLNMLLRDQLRRAKLTETTLQPVYERLRDMQAVSSGTKRYMDELNGWHNARFAWHQLLFSLQRDLPASIQLVRLEMKDEITLPKVKVVSGQTPNIPDPQRVFVVRLSGRAVGDMAEDVVGRFIQELKRGFTRVGAPVESATLLQMQRDPRSERAQSSFEIEVRGTARTLK